MDEAEKPKSALDHLENANRVYEAVTTAIAAISAFLAFVEGLGGWVQLLVQIGIMGFACYASLFVVIPLSVGAITLLEKATKRTSTDTSVVVILVSGLILGALLIRFGLFYDGIGEDFDAIGTAFSAFAGFLVVATPFVVLWWRKGSTPAR